MQLTWPICRICTCAVSCLVPGRVPEAKRTRTEANTLNQCPVAIVPVNKKNNNSMMQQLEMFGIADSVKLQVWSDDNSDGDL